MRAIALALLVISLSFAGCVERHTFERCRGDDATWNDDGTGTICVDSRIRSFLYVTSESDDPQPLLVALHGGGGSAENMLRKTRLGDHAEDDGFILVVPQGTPLTKFDNIRTWNAAHCCGTAKEDGTNDVAFLDALVEAFDERYAIDTNRVGVTGHSNGGMMAHAYGAKSDTATHIMPVAGAIGGRFPADGELEVIPVPEHDAPEVLIIHAEDDDRVPYDGGEGNNLGTQQRYDMSVDEAVTFWEDAGATVELVTVTGGHGWPGGEADIAKAPKEPDASQLVVDFLLS